MSVAVAADWAATALRPPRAYGEPLGTALLKSSPEDFLVEEQLSFEPSGSGAHWLLRVEKRAANTRWIAHELARVAGVPLAEIGYAGMKDRHAITVQWFSVPVNSQPAAFWRELRTAEYRVLEVVANTRKLQRGALRGNRFRICLRDVTWSAVQLAARVERVRQCGVPNYFGPQRFGRRGANLARVAEWVCSGRPPLGRGERGFTLSAARALLFNAVLARRVADDTWSRLAIGDQANLQGSGSHFRVTDIDDALTARLAALDIHPSGPLWGRGPAATSGVAGAVESSVAQELAAVAALIADAGLDQERRALRCVVKDLSVELDRDTCVLRFALGRGQFATAVLREICDLGDASDIETDEQ